MFVQIRISKFYYYVQFPIDAYFSSSPDFERIPKKCCVGLLTIVQRLRKKSKRREPCIPNPFSGRVVQIVWIEVRVVRCVIGLYIDNWTISRMLKKPFGAEAVLNLW